MNAQTKTAIVLAIIALAVIAAGMAVGAADVPAEADSWMRVARDTLRLLRAHESLDGRKMSGDGGNAQGFLHQHEDHWREGCAFVGVDWPWPEDTRDWEKCQHVALGNWFKYARPYLLAGRQEELIRRFRKPFDPYCDDNDEYVRGVLGR